MENGDKGADTMWNFDFDDADDGGDLLWAAACAMVVAAQIAVMLWVLYEVWR